MVARVQRINNDNDIVVLLFTFSWVLEVFVVIVGARLLRLI